MVIDSCKSVMLPITMFIYCQLSMIYKKLNNDSYHYRIDLHRREVEIESVMLYHSVSEHLPEDIAAELSQCGIDEQILLFQRFGKRTARPGVLLLDSCILHKFSDDL